LAASITSHSFSPERIDPGNREFTLRMIPKVVGGVTKSCAQLTNLLYQQIIDEIIPVSSSRVAEMTKLLENTFRIVNIGLVNELAPVAHNLGVNLWEVIDAAKTKPFGFMPFYPGPGIGGHCIGIDPLYLSWKARAVGSEIRFVELASRVNALMPNYVVRRLLSILNSNSKPIAGSKVLILGVSYKKDVEDIREAPAVEIVRQLRELNAKVNYHDPLLKSFRFDGGVLKSTALNRSVLQRQDLVLLVTPHTSIDYSQVVKHSKQILDTRIH